jgi:hypothetical protein
MADQVVSMPAMSSRAMVPNIVLVGEWPPSISAWRRKPMRSSRWGSRRRCRITLER